MQRLTAKRFLWLSVSFIVALCFAMVPLAASANGKPAGKPLIHPGYLGHAMVTNASGGAVRGNAGFTANSLAANDDDSTGLVPIGFDINYGGQVWSDLYVNNNGNVTFSIPLSIYTPFSLAPSPFP